MGDPRMGSGIANAYQLCVNKRARRVLAGDDARPHTEVIRWRFEDAAGQPFGLLSHAAASGTPQLECKCGTSGGEHGAARRQSPRFEVGAAVRHRFSATRAFELRANGGYKGYEHDDIRRFCRGWRFVVGTQSDHYGCERSHALADE